MGLEPVVGTQLGSEFHQQRHDAQVQVRGAKQSAWVMLGHAGGQWFQAIHDGQLEDA